MDILNPDLINTIGIGTTLALLFVSLALGYKMRRIKQLQSAIDRLEESLNEMDEQAKLIVRTDMELNKTQDKLDKKITCLYALQKLSRTMSTTLEENQIFKSINAGNLEDIEFEKALGILWDNAEKRFEVRLNIGYTDDQTSGIQSFLSVNKDVYLGLIQNEKTISSASPPPKDNATEKQLTEEFKVISFIISPILPKEGNKGFLFVGTEKTDTLITEGDEELITILANQLGQALENARLFEKTWRAQQDLEKKVEERTRELKSALEEVKIINQRKTNFVSSVTHELRTPLTSIKGYASILSAGKLGELPPEAKNRIDKINQHSDELAHLVNELLDISRIESGKVIMKQGLEDLKSIAEEVADILSVQLKEKSIELSINIPAASANVFIDRDQIKRVFINLIGNAIKFTPVKGKISISSKKINKEIQVDVNDTGCGIPEEAQESIFEEFYRVDNLINQQTKGTGLGLTLVKHIIEAHKGRIWVKSKVGAGSTFSFTLPQTE